MRLHVSRFLAGGDKRFGLPPYNDFKKLSLNDVVNFTEDQFKNAPLEISIVGDLDIDQVIKLTSKYMGGLPKRKKIKQPRQIGMPFVPVSKILNLNIETKIQKGRVIIAYPAEDIWDIKRTRRLSMLGEIITEKMREQLRENMGATYSPYAYNRPSRVYPGYGLFIIVVNVDPKDTQVVIKEVKRIVDEVAKNGIHEEELKRAIKPSLTSIKDLLRKNDYWLQTVLNGSLEHPEQIEWSRSILDDHAAITAGELSSLSRKYLDNEKATFVVIKPTHVK
jgi:zinc protease